ncbi:MAG TPA: aminodeoxychorismate synthase component I [Xylella sp.]
MTLTRFLRTDPDLLSLHRWAPERYPALFESTASGTPQSRWDFLLCADGRFLRLDADNVTRDANGRALPGDFLQELDSAWRAEPTLRETRMDVPPFRGGWALLLDYELAAQIEPVLRLPTRTDACPIALALRCPAAVLRDRCSGICFIVAELGNEYLLDVIEADLAAVAGVPPLPAWQPPMTVTEDEPSRFIVDVERVLDYLRAGDVFQANISRLWEARFATVLDPAALYMRLRVANPAPFSGLFVAHGRAVVSSSPERLISVQGDCIQARPIAGTRPRFVGDDDDARICELVNHPKERAEHVMLIDLERNDLGRVCVPGTVEVDELMTVESYAHVHHIVSNVRGCLRAGTTPGEIIRAVFPGGTITGCPKVRCMQIIAQLEQVARGAYTGAFGWLNRDGDLDLNILIRTAEVDGVTVRFRNGAGIVINSFPEHELDETRAKAIGLLRALDMI